MNTLIDKQYEFNLWANSEIIKLCASLDETQLSNEYQIFDVSDD